MSLKVKFGCYDRVFIYTNVKPTSNVKKDFAATRRQQRELTSFVEEFGFRSHMTYADVMDGGESFSRRPAGSRVIAAAEYFLKPEVVRGVWICLVVDNINRLGDTPEQIEEALSDLYELRVDVFIKDDMALSRVRDGRSCVWAKLYE
jgi:hypothetical protein